jgi:hypothetical protein
MRPAGDEVMRRRGTSLGGRNAGSSGRPGLLGGGVSPISAKVPAVQLLTTSRVAWAFSRAVSIASTADTASVNVGAAVTLLCLQSLDARQNLFCVARNLNLWPDRGNLARLINHKGGALNPHIAFAIHRFFQPHAKLFADIGFVIGP